MTNETTLPCEIIPFPKSIENPDEYVQIVFDEINFLMPLFVNICRYYGVVCEIKIDDEDDTIASGDVYCSEEFYHDFLFPRFEKLSMKLTDGFQEAYTNILENMSVHLNQNP